LNAAAREVISKLSAHGLELVKLDPETDFVAASTERPFVSFIVKPSGEQPESNEYAVGYSIGRNQQKSGDDISMGLIGHPADLIKSYGSSEPSDMSEFDGTVGHAEGEYAEPIPVDFRDPASIEAALTKIAAWTPDACSNFREAEDNPKTSTNS
jgi:hypothetical protein